MKRKVLTMLLAVSMTATMGSPICAADFTSGTENVEEFFEDTIENTETSEDTMPEEATKEMDPDIEEITDTEEDEIPEFDDGQEDVLTDSAEKPSSSAKYPSMKKTSEGVYTATLKNTTENSYVKFIPGKTAKYVLKKTSTYNGYSNTSGAYYVYDSKFKVINTVSDRGYSCYKLEKGKTYYLGCDPASKVVFHAEILTDVVSIKPVKIDKSIVFYTPLDFYQDSYESNNKNQYDVAERWRGKIKITYSDGKTETISTDHQNKYGEYLTRYVIYNGKKSSPVAGTYDVHLKFSSSNTEAIVKNVKVKKISSMPTLNGSGKKTVNVGSSGVYVRFKTGKSTKYLISFSFPNYNLGQWPISIMQEKNGKLTSVNHIQNGGICTLKANTVYYFSANIHSGWLENPTVTLTATPKN